MSTLASSSLIKQWRLARSAPTPRLFGTRLKTPDGTVKQVKLVINFMFEIDL